MDTELYIVFKNSLGCELCAYKIDHHALIADQLVNLLKERAIILLAGDTISFEIR